MATLRQIEANRLNALKSTGPKTAAGKAAACLNNLKHGLRARTAVLPEESQEDFDRLCQRLAGRYQPEGVDEEHLVEQMAISWWKAARVGRLEEAMFASVREQVKKPSVFGTRPALAQAPPERVMENAMERSVTLRDLSLLEARHERAYFRAEKELRQLQKERLSQSQLDESDQPAHEAQPPAQPDARPEPAPQPAPSAPPLGDRLPPVDSVPGAVPSVPAALPDRRPPLPAAAPSEKKNGDR